VGCFHPSGASCCDVGCEQNHCRNWVKAPVSLSGRLADRCFRAKCNTVHL